MNGKIGPEPLREQVTVTDLAPHHQNHPNQIHSWKNRLQEQAARAFDPKIAREADPRGV